MSNQQFTPSNNINKIKGSHSKEKTNKFLSTFNNFSSNQNQITNFILSENQRNINKFKSQKKLRQKDSYSKNLTENKHSTFFDSNNINNIKLKNYSNIMIKNSKLIRNMNSKNKYKTKNKSQSLLKPNIEIEAPNSTNTNHNIDNMSTNAHSRLNTNNNTNNKRYKKNISEHDLVNNILNTFTNYNFPKNINSKINNYTNYSSKKKINYGKNVNNNINSTKKTMKQNSNINNMNRPKTASETKLFRSSSGYSYINNNLFYTNSFFNGFNGDIPNHLNYIPTWGNSPDFANNNGNCNSKQKNNKAPIIGKIIKNYKNNDLNCIFNMNLIPPSSVNNIQDYFKNLYKVEYNNENRNKKHEKNIKKEKENNSEGINLKIINEDNKRIMGNKRNEIKNNKNWEESVEEIHFYYVHMVQSGKNLEKKLIKK
jgi:hypothetical protein